MKCRITTLTSAMLFLALLLVLLPAAARAEGSVEINAANFPDTVFRNYVSKNFDTDKDGSLSEEEINAVELIYVPNYSSSSAASIKGVEFFTQVKQLTCASGKLTEADVSKNTKLEKLNLYGNKLTSLDLSNNTALTLLKVDANQLTSLDLSKLSLLEDLTVSENPLTGINLKNNPKLTKIACQKCQIESLDLSGNPELVTLSVNNNQLTSLDLSGNPKLGSLNVSKNPLSSLDLSGNPELASFSLSGCQFTSLNVSKNPELLGLTCDQNVLTGLDLSSNPKLAQLKCEENKLTELDLSKNPEITRLYCGKNMLEKLDVSALPELKELKCRDSHIKTLVIGQKASLEVLECSGNELESLDLTKAYALGDLDCSDNKLKSLDLSRNNALFNLDCGDNEISALDLSGNTMLLALYCENNRLEDLDLTGPSAIQVLSCYGNPFRELDLRSVSNLKYTVLEGEKDSSNEAYDKYTYYSNALYVDKAVTLFLEGDGILISKKNFPDDVFRNYVKTQFDKNEDNVLNEEEIAAVTNIFCNMNHTASLKGIEYFTGLTILSCIGNEITELDLSKNTALERLDCSKNQLKQLDLSRNTALTILEVTDNELEALDISNNKALTLLNLKNNKLKALDISKNTKLSYLSCYGNQIPVLNLKNVPLLKNAFLNGMKYSDETLDAYYIDAEENGASLLVDKNIILLPEGNPFVDIKEGKFYYVPVLWAFTRNPKITGGTDDTHFSPNNDCTRGEVVTFLWRSQGCPEPTLTKCPFKDVKAGKFYYKAVLWAVENEITTGKSPTTFEPNGKCTRAEFVTFLWRTVGKPAPALTETDFTDVKEGKFYYVPMLWAVENGITTGTSPTTFAPNDLCSRGQVVTFLYRTIAK